MSSTRTSTEKSIVSAYAAHSADAPLKPFRIERRNLRGDDVELEVIFCGVCHSDIHHVRSDWGTENYPIVPGHEIIGRVLRIGPDVRRFRVGQTVGVGCLVDSCRTCDSCNNNMEQYCAKGSTLTYAGKDRHDGTPTYGGYSGAIVVSDRFVLSVPQGIDLAGLAPLLCAGITTYSPLKRFGAGPKTKVAVVGLGGLGHVAVKLAKAMGARVTLFSRSGGKEAEAERLGADTVVISSDPAAMQAATGTFDIIIDTIPYQHDLNPYIGTLAAHGSLVLVGYLGPLEDALNTAPIVARGKCLAGSLIGGLAETQEMLDFCAAKGVIADVEIINIQEVNDAYERMLKSDVKYRFVIDMSSLGK